MPQNPSQQTWAPLPLSVRRSQSLLLQRDSLSLAIITKTCRISSVVTKLSFGGHGGSTPDLKALTPGRHTRFLW